ALLTDKGKVKEQLVEAEQSLEKIQEEEVRKSVSATDTQSEDEEESQFKTKAQEVKVKEFSFSSSSESDSEEEERVLQDAYNALPISEDFDVGKIDESRQDPELLLKSIEQEDYV
ncbi:hypothetical protein STEG23_031077, partial [Scotinomys teguina]